MVWNHKVKENKIMKKIMKIMVTVVAVVVVLVIGFIAFEIKTGEDVTVVTTTVTRTESGLVSGEKTYTETYSYQIKLYEDMKVLENGNYRWEDINGVIHEYSGDYVKMQIDAGNDYETVEVEL